MTTDLAKAESYSWHGFLRWADGGRDLELTHCVVTLREQPSSRQLRRWSIGPRAACLLLVLSKHKSTPQLDGAPGKCLYEAVRKRAKWLKQMFTTSLEPNDLNIQANSLFVCGIQGEQHVRSKLNPQVVQFTMLDNLGHEQIIADLDHWEITAAALGAEWKGGQAGSILANAYKAWLERFKPPAGNGREQDEVENLISEIADTQLEPPFQALRRVVLEDARAAVHQMADHKCCDFPFKTYYKATRALMEQIRTGGKVCVTNLLAQREWISNAFTEYLPLETRLIEEKRLEVTRFFVGTVEEFENENVQRHLSSQRKQGVIVRSVYVDRPLTDSIGSTFDRDIGIYGTMPESFIEGISEDGELLHGKFGTNPDQLTSIRRVFEVLSKYATARTRRRNDAERQSLARSMQGWQLPYDEEGPAWQSHECPMLKEYFEPVLRKAVQRATEQQRDHVTIVDLGCGDGRNFAYMAQICTGLTSADGIKFELIGLDFCERAVRRCRETIHSLPSSNKYAAAARNFVDDVPAVTGTVDLLIAVDVATHIYHSELPVALKEWNRVLRDEGILLFNAYTPLDDTIKHCRADVENRIAESGQLEGVDNAWWYRDTFYKYYEWDELHRQLGNAHFASTHNIMTWRDPPHGRYRPHAHDHHNLVITATKGPEAHG